MAAAHPAHIPFAAPAPEQWSLASSLAEIVGANAAIVAVRAVDKAPDIVSSFGLVAMPLPQPPFMLACRDAGDVAVHWQSLHGRDWLHVELPIRADAKLVLSASIPADRERGAVESLLPFVRHALRAFAAGHATQARADGLIASYEAALNQSVVGIVLVRCDGTLMFANRTARALMQSGDGLRQVGESIGARDLNDAVKLQVAIDHVCTAAPGDIDDPVVAVRRRHGGRPLMVCISPAIEDDGRRCSEAGAILRIVDPDTDLRPLMEPVCAHHGLSGAEARLACLLAAGATLEGAAAELRIKEQTARSYLKQIFLKTETNRQSDLVRVMLAGAVRATPVRRFRLL